MLLLPPTNLLDRHPPIAQAITMIRDHAALVLGLSAVLNLLALAGAIYMMLVYDSVLPSASGPTLVALTALVTLLYVWHGWFDSMRQRLLHRMAAAIDDLISDHLFSLCLRSAAQGQLSTSSPMQHWDRLRHFLTSPAPLAVLDLPWMVLFLAMLALLHPLLALAAGVSAILLFLLAYYGERRASREAAAIAEAGEKKARSLHLAMRHAPLLRALGSTDAFRYRLRQDHETFVAKQVEQAEGQAVHQASSRASRLLVQSLVLAVGALLVIKGNASGGIIFAGAILAGRALAPIDQLMGYWATTVAARTSWHDLQQFLEHNSSPDTMAVQFERPKGTLELEGVEIVAAPDLPPLFPPIDLAISAGSIVAVIGQSGAGKSSLLRTLARMTKPAAGTLRLGRVAYGQWPEADFGHLIGYLPPTVDLIAGSIADNISRFKESATASDIIAAARRAGVHDAILTLRDGYETRLTDDGRNIPGGLAQRIGIARAMFGNPPLLILDEPTSNQDQNALIVLYGALQAYAKQGNSVVLATHNGWVINQAPRLLLLSPGNAPLFGQRDAVLTQLSGSRAFAADLVGQPRPRV